MNSTHTLNDILRQFQEYLQTEEARKHLYRMTSEKKEVKQIMQKLSTFDKHSKDFTELVLYGLLPYSKTSVAKRVSLFPAFMNIKVFFSDYKYTDEEWNLIANRIYDLCDNFNKNPVRLGEFIEEFTKDKYSRRLQCGSITPIFYCLNDSFPIINNRAIRAFRSMRILLGKKEKLSQKLNDYLDNINKINALINDLKFDVIKNHDYQDLFFYWYDSEFLNEERRANKIESEEDENISETEQEVKSEDINIPDFIGKIDAQKDFEFTPHSLGDPQRIKINQIISNVEKTKWVLPHFQRYFDWNKNDVKEFWESIFNDYYVGSFLMWDTDRSPELGIQPILGVNKNEEDLRPESIILDGQQRITSLYYAIKSPKINLKGSKVPLFYYINFKSFFSKNNTDGFIEIHARKISKDESNSKMLFPLYELENSNKWIDEFEDFLVKITNDSDKAREVRRVMDKKLRHIWEGFEIPYIALPESMKLYQVTDIFENINTKGKLLSVFDLLIARLYKYSFELKKMWNATLTNYPNISRYSKSVAKIPIYILQAMSLLYEKTSSAKRADILDIYSNVYEYSDRDFEEDWDDIAEYMNKAIEKLENMRDGYGVKDEKELPFESTIPVLTALLKVVDQKENKADCYEKIDKWYWSAVFTNAYSSAADSQMTSDFKEVRNWFDDNSKTPKVVIGMIKDLPTIEFKDIQSKSNSKYKGIMALVALKGAKDFNTSQNLENARQNDKDHIFPKSFNFGSNKYINSVLNMTWMSAETNRNIKKYKKPSVYIKDFISQKYNQDENAFANLLETHLISKEAYSLLSSDDFEGFLYKREEAIISLIKDILEIHDTNAPQTLISPQNPFTNKRIIGSTINSCKEYIYWVDKYFSKVGLELLHEYMDYNKVKDIKILVSLDYANEILRSAFQDFKNELKNRDITCGLRIICDNKTKSSIHDRWIITKNSCFNLPSPDVIARGQYSEINKTTSIPPFDEWWKNSLDIIQDWNNIKEQITSLNLIRNVNK
ncbi:MAG: DUF262 domain-containing protein [Elusimicrobiota bacterium]